MNYYDALLQHRHRLEDVERHQENARHLRDSQRKPEAEQTETPKRSSAFLRVMNEAKAAVASLNLGGQRVMDAGHAVAVKDICG